jgi:hypothetical protein
VLDSQGAFVAGKTRRTVWRTPTAGPEPSNAGARSREALGRGGRFGSPVVHSNHVGGRTLRVDAAGGNVSSGLRERRAQPGACGAEGRLGPVNTGSLPQGRSFVATAFQPKPLVEEWLSGRSEAGGNGREVATTGSRSS